VLDDAARRNAYAVGRVLAAAVYHFVGKAKGLIHEIWVARRPAAPGRGGQLTEVLGNLTPEMVQGVRNAFLSVREFAEAKLPHLAGSIFEFDYTYKVTKEDEPSGGLSAGLPTALAFLSAFLNRPVPQDLAASGTLVADAHDVLTVRSVGEPEYKVRGAYNRNLRMLLLPAENGRELASTPLVPRAVTERIVRRVSSFDEAVTLVFGEEVWT
jgi:ATP-dependent Lon protease